MRESDARGGEKRKRAVDALCTDPHTPHVLRALAADWPATRHWTFGQLALLGPHEPVRLVLGNRECEATRFAHSTFGQYMEGLERGDAQAGPVPYLKEFDLLRRFPVLRQDLRMDGLFPRGAWVWNDVWIGPKGSHTGLHRDLLDNVAVLLRGRKRFRLAPPGSIEALQATSTKYDRVSVMATAGLDELRERAPGLMVHDVDLEPGDALYTPAGWWHEVSNPEASIFLSGFFGKPLAVSAKWAATLPRHLLHQAGLWHHGNCVCHS
ncbi:MAG TPA: cupin-like domain-containing protein [Ramlibacter sp.]|nr:cupin-like domain-containing protein [Ramlibacter sp.]